MERRSFLLPRRGEARAPCFQDVDLRAQPFLTKRGRASKQVVKRVFVVLDGTFLIDRRDDLASG